MWEEKPHRISGDNGMRAPPVPIPNTEVKPHSADGTWLETAREGRSSPDSISLNSSMAEHSAVNRRVVGSSPTWGVKKKREHHRCSFSFFLLRKFSLNKSFIEQPNRLVNCKGAETLAVRGGVRRLWRSGRNFASERARSFGYHKSYCVRFHRFERGLGE